MTSLFIAGFMKTVLIKKRYFLPSEPYFHFTTSKGLKITISDKTRAKLKINRWSRRLGHVLKMPNDRIAKASLTDGLQLGGEREAGQGPLAEDGDEGTERDGSLKGQSTSQSTGQGSAVGYDCDLMSQPG